ncbi:LYR motif-containing protein 1 isoform X3 [Lepus europaeus]|uniref:LYR motif-containing protein 1 isoform X3 n=1 Tax=Lepus europaeus TaxID=9983 RepID=UPI002B45C5C6|nr:LYR motif-containing protein 1 isoform X3 [Lepus europaeus]
MRSVWEKEEPRTSYRKIVWIRSCILNKLSWMTTATRQEVLGLYRSIFRLARKWQAASGQMEDTIKEKQYILNEARTLFQKNKNLTDPDLIKQCIDECTARIEIGLHYQIPYPRPSLSESCCLSG